MDKREAKRRAWRAAYQVIEGLRTDGGSLLDAMVDDETSAEDIERLEWALDEVCQDIFERGH